MNPKRDTLYNIINGIDKRFPLNEGDTYTVGYELDGKKYSWNVKANNDNDAEDKFDDYMGGNGKTKYKVKDTYKSTSNDDDVNEAMDDEEFDDPEEFDDSAVDEYSPNDIVISSNGWKFNVGSEEYGHIGEFEEENDAYKAAYAWMKKNKFYPNVWLQDDHGGMELADPYEFRDVAEGCGDGEKDELDEENMTSNIDGGMGQPKTPFAFQRKRPTSSDKRKQRKNSTSSTGWEQATKTNRYFVRRDEMIQRAIDVAQQLSEIKYKEFATDPAMSPKQKINMSIKEVNRLMYEIEGTVNRVSKLKTETGIDDVFWKSTRDRFMKISERMLRIGNKIRELNQ
jgi:hypothetical protein